MDIQIVYLYSEKRESYQLFYLANFSHSAMMSFNNIPNSFLMAAQILCIELSHFPTDNHLCPQFSTFRNRASVNIPPYIFIGVVHKGEVVCSQTFKYLPFSMVLVSSFLAANMSDNIGGKDWIRCVASPHPCQLKLTPGHPLQLLLCLSFSVFYNTGKPIIKRQLSLARLGKHNLLMNHNKIEPELNTFLLGYREGSLPL